MTVRDKFGEQREVTRRDSWIERHPKDLDQFDSGAPMMDTLIELAATIVGFLGVLLLIFASLKILGYAQ